tara:strand:+ start:33 stop:230 length:198 start_codon:yes stop_codon:yes gene_type:complete
MITQDDKNKLIANTVEDLFKYTNRMQERQQKYNDYHDSQIDSLTNTVFIILGIQLVINIVILFII